MELPEKWDTLATDYFQTREFLVHTEKYNPCGQRYHLLFRDDVFQVGVVFYTLKLDLLTYLSIPSPFRMNIGGIPCSVSSHGIVGDPNHLPPLMDYVKLREKGMLLLLNLEPDLNFNNMIRGRTLPTFILANTFLSWEDYLQSLRADYRRRINHFTVSFTEVVYKRIPCKDFDCQLYNLYLDVLGHSKGKLETLSLEFFQNLPAVFCLTAFYDREQTIGWIITTMYHGKLSFFLGGVDYRKNRQFNTYFNLLAEVVKEGIEKKATLIDLGQTAEIPKMRMGGSAVEKTMIASHSNPVFRLLLKAAKGWLEYSPTLKEVHVFKETV